MKKTIFHLLPVFVLAFVALSSGLLKAQEQDTCRIMTEMKQLRLTCSNSDAENGNTAQVKVTVDGGVAPYSYVWRTGSPGHWGKELSPMHIAPNDPSKAISLKGYRWYHVEVTDSRGCTKCDSIFTKAYPTPNIVISCEPGDSVYIQNPDVTFSFENLPKGQDSVVIALDHFLWTFEHGLTSTQEKPVFTYVESSSVPFQATLTVYDLDCGCDTTFVKDVYVLPVKLKIPTVFTPNGDGYNVKFVITLSSGSDTPGGNSGNNNRSVGSGDEIPLNVYYKSTELVVMNRWGRVVYHSTDYQNDWNGDGLADGTYFYVLKCKGLKEEVRYEGTVMILTKTR